MPDRPPLCPREFHGGPGSRAFGGLDFSVNSNPLGPDPVLLQALRDADHSIYPDPSYAWVREALAHWHGRQPGEVALAVGASELLHRTVRAFVSSGEVVQSVGAPFGEFARAAALARARLEVVGEAAQAVRSGVRLVYLGHPHNPTGRRLEGPELLELLDRCEAAGALLMLDEAYAPFVQAYVPPPHPRLIRLRSPGKAHGLVGARPAYALAAPDITAQLENLAPAWHLPAGTAAVLAALPGAGRFLSMTLPLVSQLARNLAGQLSRFGAVEHHGTPFMTLEVGEADRVSAALLELGLKVRGCASYGQPSRIRISTRTADENRRLVQGIGQLFQGGVSWERPS